MHSVRDIYDISAADMTMSSGASAYMISNIASMSKPWDMDDAIAKSRSMLDAARLVVEVLPRSHANRVMRFVPREVAEIAWASYSADSEMLKTLSKSPERLTLRQLTGSALAFAMARGVGVIDIELNRDRFHRSLEVEKIAPADAYWTRFEKATKEWNEHIVDIYADGSLTTVSTWGRDFAQTLGDDIAIALVKAQLNGGGWYGEVDLMKWVFKARTF